MLTSARKIKNFDFILLQMVHWFYVQNFIAKSRSSQKILQFFGFMTSSSSDDVIKSYFRNNFWCSLIRKLKFCTLKGIKAKKIFRKKKLKKMMTSSFYCKNSNFAYFCWRQQEKSKILVLFCYKWSIDFMCQILSPKVVSVVRHYSFSTLWRHPVWWRHKTVFTIMTFDVIWL